MLAHIPTDTCTHRHTRSTFTSMYNVIYRMKTHRHKHTDNGVVNFHRMLRQCVTFLEMCIYIYIYILSGSHSANIQ